MSELSHSVNRPDVTLYVEAGRVGLGHAGRAVSLAEVILRKGWQLEVVLQGDDRGIFAECGIPTVSRHSGRRSHVVIVDWQIPARVLAQSQLTDALVVVIDSEDPEEISADLFIQPPTSLPRLRSDKTVLEGPEFALVRSEFTGTCGNPVPDGHIFVSFGGADPQGLSGPVVNELERGARPVASTTTVQSAVQPKMSAQYRGASLFVGAFGHSLIEAATCGVPALYVSWDHQDPKEAAGFERWGTAMYLGAASQNGVVEAISRTAGSFLRDRRQWSAMSRVALSQFDGRGAWRAVDQIESLVRGLVE